MHKTTDVKTLPKGSCASWLWRFVRHLFFFSMNDKAQEIHDMIQTAPIEVSETAISTLLDIVTALNDRISTLETRIRRLHGDINTQLP